MVILSNPLSWAVQADPGLSFGWVSVVAAFLVIAATLGAAVAVYRTSLQSTSLREAERTIERLRGEINDYDRREEDLKHKIELLEGRDLSNGRRIKVMEDLLTKRKDDDVIRAEIAAVREVVDKNVMAQLTAIQELLTKGNPAS